MAEALDISFSTELRRAQTAGLLEYEDDDEETPPKDSFAIHGPSYEVDHILEEFKRDFATAQAMHREKAEKLSQIQNDEQKAQKRPAIIQECNEKFRQFVESRSNRWAEKTSLGAGSRNFLHHLAYENPSSRDYPQYLVFAASTIQPQLMSVVDGKGRTPLTAAITETNSFFCYNAVLRPNDEQRRMLGKYLEVECRAGREFDHDREATCLHAALTATFYERLKLDRLKFITKLISLVPKAMFKIQDFKYRTPLHLAVQYENCSKDQVSIVKMLLAEGPEALGIESQESLGRNVSIFQSHELSKAKYEQDYEQTRKALEKEEQERMRLLNEKQMRQRYPENMSGNRMSGWTENKGPSKDEKQAKLGAESRKSDAKKAESKPKRGDMEAGPVPDRIGKTDANVTVRRNSITSGASQARESSPTPWHTERRTAAANQLYQAVNTTVMKYQTRLDDKLKLMEEEEIDRRDAAAKITDMLKLLCLRTYEPEQASRFLRSIHGKQGLGLDKALWFDFGPSGQPRKLRWKDFVRDFKHFQFESILQYVAFPHVDLLGETRSQDNEEYTFPMVALFNWLRDGKRGVQRIIRVIVNDFDSPSHTDEAIEKALYNFGVEILDWRRLDICPASLAAIGSDLREVTLYWGGSNSVLRGWSEVEGLARLENLEVINIVEMDGIESAKRVGDNLEAFETRLHKSWPKNKEKPTIVQHDGRRSRASGQRGDIHSASQGFDYSHDRGIAPHKWLDCMKKFSEEFNHIKEVTQKNTDPGLSPVVVALIDDGTDFTHHDLRVPQTSTLQTFEGRSFSMYTDGSGVREDPWWHSESGHGTLMARLIKAICPSAIIHVIKLSTHFAQGSKKLQIDPESAVKAIEYATKLGSHIISMSWTIKPPEEPLKSRFSRAVNSAINDKGILMFCAAADQGNFTERTFPHAINSTIFRIGAAAATGKILDTVGDRESLSFILPGHEVVIDHWYDDVADQTFAHFEPHSGSSVATALAASLAALIIECVRLGVIHTQLEQSDSTLAVTMKDLQRIQEQETMKRAMSSINTDTDAKRLYLQVWDLFEKSAEKLKAARFGGEPGGYEQLEIVSGLARHFLRKGAF